MQRNITPSHITPSHITPSTVIGGLLIGYLATQALDLVSTAIYEREDQKTYDEENAARGGHHAYENGIQQMAKGLGRDLNENQIRNYGWRFHRAFGIFGGIQYALLRRKFPSLGKGYGLLYGLGFFLLADEYLMPAMQLTPGPTRFSWKVHARGLAAHVAYGVTAELAARIFDVFIEPLQQATLYARNSSLYSGHPGDVREVAQNHA